MSEAATHISADIHRVLKQHWGYDQFRPMQEDIISSVLSGKDTLALLPTGGGKSICFQVPGLYHDGICLVISPLIALMKDQVLNLRKRNIAASAIFSGMSYREIDITLDNAVYGGLKFLYVSPERLTTDIFRDRVKRMPINLLAVDEAHCISQWGYDFRPPYLKIAEARELLEGDVPVLALTASATRQVEEDIREKLQFKKGAQTFRNSFARDNLVYLSYLEENKPAKLLEIANKIKGSGIIYVRNRRRTQEVAEFLKKSGVSASFYHAGLETKERNRRQEHWIAGDVRVMVCTNAFGMGIDKPDVRFVVHLDLPDSLEAYYQEAGRAGRDSRISYATILYNQPNLDDLKETIDKQYPAVAMIRKVYNALGDQYQLAVGSGVGQSFDFTLPGFCKTFGLDIPQTYQVLRLLEQEGLIATTEAVFLGSRVKIVAQRDKLYELEVANRRLDPLIKAILRTYEGAFDHYVRIREKPLAKACGITEKELTAYLEELDRMGFIYFEPAKDKPQIIFLEPRQPARGDFGIDFGRLRQRRNIYADKVRAMDHYTRNRSKCRSQVLLAYFGESTTEPCGRCDVCRGKYTGAVEPKIFDAVEEQLRNLLLEKPRPVKELTQAISKVNDEFIIAVLRWMLDHAIARENDQSEIVLNPENP